MKRRRAAVSRGAARFPATLRCSPQSASSRRHEMEPTDEAILYSAYRIYSDLTDESILSSMVVAPKSAHMDELMAHELAKHGHTEEPIAEFAKVKELAKEAPP